MDHGVFQKVLTVIAKDKQEVKDDYSRALTHAYMLGLSFRVDDNDFELNNFPQESPGCVQCGKGMQARHLLCTVVTMSDVPTTVLMCEAGRYKECMHRVTFCLDCCGGWYGDHFAVRLRPGRRYMWQCQAVVVESTSLINSKGQVLHHLEFGDLKPSAFMPIT